MDAKAGGGDTYTVTFANTCGYGIDIPSPIIANKGEEVTLPVVDDDIHHVWMLCCGCGDEFWEQGQAFVATEDVTLVLDNDR